MRKTKSNQPVTAHLAGGPFRRRVLAILVTGLLGIAPSITLAADSQSTQGDIAFQQLKADLNRALARNRIPSFSGEQGESSEKAKSAHGAYDPHSTLGPIQHLKVALQHQEEGRPALALETLDQAIAQYPGEFRLYAVRGGMYQQSSQLSAALADFNRAIEVDPGQPGLYVNRASLLSRFDRHEEAMDDLNRAIELDPEMLPAYFNRGALHYQGDRLDMALADFDQCIAIDPHQPGPYFNRAAIYQLMARNEEAIADMERFLQLAENENWRSQGAALIAQWRVAASTTPQNAGNEGS